MTSREELRLKAQLQQAQQFAADRKKRRMAANIPANNAIAGEKTTDGKVKAEFADGSTVNAGLLFNASYTQGGVYPAVKRNDGQWFLLNQSHQPIRRVDDEEEEVIETSLVKVLYRKQIDANYQFWVGGDGEDRLIYTLNPPYFPDLAPIYSFSYSFQNVGVELDDWIFALRIFSLSPKQGRVIIVDRNGSPTILDGPQFIDFDLNSTGGNGVYYGSAYVIDTLTPILETVSSQLSNVVNVGISPVFENVDATGSGSGTLFSVDNIFNPSLPFPINPSTAYVYSLSVQAPTWYISEGVASSTNIFYSYTVNHIYNAPSFGVTVKVVDDTSFSTAGSRFILPGVTKSMLNSSTGPLFGPPPWTTSATYYFPSLVNTERTSVIAIKHVIPSRDDLTPNDVIRGGSRNFIAIQSDGSEISLPWDANTFTLSNMHHNYVGSTLYRLLPSPTFDWIEGGGIPLRLWDLSNSGNEQPESEATVFPLENYDSIDTIISASYYPEG